MNSLCFKNMKMAFTDHPKFKNVRIAVFVTGKDTQMVSVCMLEIAPDTEIPVHTHDPQIDSIFVAEGCGEAFVDGRWERIEQGDYIFVPSGEEHGIRNMGDDPLRLFVHHSPPLL